MCVMSQLFEETIMCCRAKKVCSVGHRLHVLCLGCFHQSFDTLLFMKS